MSDSRLGKCRQAHRLRAIELWILKGSQTREPVSERRRKEVLLQIELIAHDQFEFAGQCAFERRVLPATRGRCGPGGIIDFLEDRQANTGDSSSSFGLGGQSRSAFARNLLDGREKFPLIG